MNILRRGCGLLNLRLLGKRDNMGRLIQISKLPKIRGLVDVSSLYVEALDEIDERIEKLFIHFGSKTEQTLSTLSKLLEKGDVYHVKDENFVTTLSMHELIEEMSIIIEDVIKTYGLRYEKPKRRKK